jgi:hypothetical protein
MLSLPPLATLTNARYFLYAHAGPSILDFTYSASLAMRYLQWRYSR